MKLSFDRNHQIFNCFRNSFRNALLCRSRSAEKVRCCKAFQGFCDRCARKFSRPPRYDHFDIPPYRRNYEIVLEKTLEEKTLLSEKCVCFPQIRGFFADCFRYGKEVSRPPRYDRFDIPPYGCCGKGLPVSHALFYHIFAGLSILFGGIF